MADNRTRDRCRSNFSLIKPMANILAPGFQILRTLIGLFPQPPPRGKAYPGSRSCFQAIMTIASSRFLTRYPHLTVARRGRLD